jgi:hypothetical protein
MPGDLEPLPARLLAAAPHTSPAVLAAELLGRVRAGLPMVGGLGEREQVPVAVWLTVLRSARTRRAYAGTWRPGSAGSPGGKRMCWRPGECMWTWTVIKAIRPACQVCARIGRECGVAFHRPGRQSGIAPAHSLPMVRYGQITRRLT